MQKVLHSRQQLLLELAKISDIDYEKTFSARELAFVTKDGNEYWSPTWNVYIQQLVEKANAKLDPEGCHKYPRSYILLVKEDEVKEPEPEATETEEVEKSSVKRGRKSTK